MRVRKRGGAGSPRGPPLQTSSQFGPGAGKQHMDYRLWGAICASFANVGYAIGVDNSPSFIDGDGFVVNDPNTSRKVVFYDNFVST